MRKSPIITGLLLLAAISLTAQDFQEKGGFELEAQHFFEQADNFYDSGALEAAAEFYAAAAEADPDHPKALYNLALTHYELHNFGKAEVALEKFIQQNPQDTLAYELYGHTMLQRGNLAKAIECFDLLLSAMPTDDRYVHRALANLHAQRTNQALNDFDEAIRLNPQHFEAALGKGIVLLELDQTALASAWFEKALAIRPGDATALSNLGISKFQQGDKEGAMSDFRSAIFAGRQSKIFLARARCFLIDRNYGDALADAKEALLLDGEDPEVYAFIGEIEMEKGDFMAAIESFGVAIDLKPDKANYYLCRADSNIRNKQYYDAVSDLYRALDLEPFNTDARTMLQVAYRHIDLDIQEQSLSENGSR